MTIVIVKGGALASDTKQRMIERAAILLAKKGLQGTSFSEVLEASGAPRGSLYHHFPGGKQELVLSALTAARDQAMTMLHGMRGRPATEIAQRFVGLWRTVLSKSDFNAGCAVVAVAVAAESPALRESAAAVFRTWRSQLGELFVAGGIPAERAFAMSATLVSACEGAVILARAERSFEPFDLMATEQLGAISAAMTNATES
jgi:TetR/AcrR family transcriptional regulator, lmrAB and yxaGH operons repressor